MRVFNMVDNKYDNDNDDNDDGNDNVDVIDPTIAKKLNIREHIKPSVIIVLYNLFSMTN